MLGSFEQDFSNLAISNDCVQNQSYGNLGYKTVDLPSVIHNYQAINSENKRDNLLLVDYDSQSFSSKNETNSQDSLRDDKSNESSTLFRSRRLKKTVNNNKQHEQSSATINCQWHINFNNCKGTTDIVCTSFVDSYNYELNSLITQTAPRFCKLTKKMLKDIEFYTCSTEGISATLHYNLLKAKHPDNYINKKDVLEQLNNATNGITPKNIYSDANLAMDFFVILEIACLKSTLSATRHDLLNFLNHSPKQHEEFISAKTCELQQIKDEKKIYKNMSELQQAIKEEEFDENTIEKQVANLFVTKRWGWLPK
ncbi:18690_t:CDS:2 [Dentiscutata erythropus]|uniref:18690_t:CDS:1 n=1 Tax=Dentiscutata erythropus TaxID=1348616 RepID=A0A9N9EWE3_9GLOM|nr:18690_t:CDS:2 [Dentiscutata erythropus]